MTEQTVEVSEFGFDDIDLSWLRNKEGVKWRGPGPSVLPAWVADMDFPLAAPIRDALAETVGRGDLGYPAWTTWTGQNPLAEPFAGRMAQRYGWQPRPEWVRNFSDLLQALQVVLHLTTKPGDAVALHTPNYPPFLMTVEMMRRRVVASQIERSSDGWGFDPERLERDVAKSKSRTLMIANPHNPTGRVFTSAELETLADIALRNDMLIVSDEILADLAYTPHRHIPMASLGPEVADRTITMTSATKAFNFAGLRCAVVHVGPTRVRQVIDAYPPDFFGPVNVLGVDATKAAWQHGDAWLVALLDHLRRNRDLVAGTIVRHMPVIKYDPPEAAYLAWLDCRGLELAEDPGIFFRNEGRVELSPGETFGPAGHGFARLNFATSREVLTEILRRMTTATAKVRVSARRATES
jgi:cystathionine beta-lyase